MNVRGQMTVIFLFLGGLTSWAALPWSDAPVYSLAPIDRVIGWVDSGGGNPRDTWKVEVPSAGLLIATLEGVDWKAELDLALFDEEGEILDLSRKKGSGHERVYTSVPKGGGAFYIQVRASEGVSAGYALTVFAPVSVSVLLFQSKEAFIARDALKELKIPFEEVNTLSEFLDRTTNKNWDLIIVHEVDDLDIDSAGYSALVYNQLARGGACIVTDYDLKRDEEFLEKLGLIWLGYCIEKNSLQSTGKTSIFSLIHDVRSELEGDVVGNVIHPAGATELVATLGGNPGLGMVATSHGGRFILNSFSLDFLGDDEASVDFFINELAYVLLAARWSEFERAPFRYRSPVDYALSYAWETKFFSMLEELSLALDRLVPRSPAEREVSSLVVEDLLPGPGDPLVVYQRKIEAMEKLLVRVSDLVNIGSSFFNVVIMPKKVRDLLRDICLRAEFAQAWLRDLQFSLAQPSDAEVGVYPLPLAPVFTRIYPAYKSVPQLAWCQAYVVNHTDQTQSVTLRISVPNLTDSQTTTLTVPPSTAMTVDFAPPLLPKAEGLNKQVFGWLVLEVNGQKHLPLPVQFLPEDEFPLDPRLYPYLIAWVTSDDPKVGDFAREALKNLEPDQDPQRKAKALWDALQEAGFRYKEARPGSTRWSQRIRLPTDALEEKGGNCIESAILMASLLEAVGIEPLVIVIPEEKHAMVGWQTSTGGYEFLETTFLEGGLISFDVALLWGTNRWKFDYSTRKLIWLNVLSTQYVIDAKAVYVLDIAALREAWNAVLSAKGKEG
jgi:hypothetical protein